MSSSNVLEESRLKQSDLLSWQWSLKQFIEQNDQNIEIVNTTINNNKDNILDAFGGLNNMIHLCLTNPNACQHIAPEKFSKFESIMNAQHICNPFATIDDAGVQAHPIGNSDLKYLSLSDKELYAIGQQPIESAPASKDITMNIDNDSGVTIACDKDEYKHHRLILHSSKQDTLYLSIRIPAVCHWAVMSFVFFIMLLAVIIHEVSDRSALYLILLTIVHSFTTTYMITMLLTCNKIILRLIINTFDFWFIVWNLLNMHISRAIIGVLENDPIYYKIARSASATVAILLAVIIDGVYIERHPMVTKKILRILVILFYVIFNVSVYFHVKDVTWNPFEKYGIKESQLSFKSLYLSSVSNVALFAFKPMFKDAIKLCYRIRSAMSHVIGNLNENENLTSDIRQSRVPSKDYEACGSLYKRLYIQWINKKAEKKEQSMSKAVTAEEKSDEMKAI